jgi:restriction endonuclease S subunit
MHYQLTQHINNNKVFIVQRSEIEGRLEPEFYKPSIADLEKTIRGKSSHKLRDYALSIAGGATPKKTESDKYYADKETGVPFLRVQNLNTDGTLSFDDCLYINKETHDGMLARSQVSEGDLLVKITGVGRMAIASVAPEGLIANTNQHMVVVKTGNKEISKYLARYLNLDIIEKIASRHSTGGTRPALDYPSVKNLPIIEGIDFSSIDRAIELKKQKETEAQKLLDSIDAYILNELGITLPESKTDLGNRFFIVSRSTLDKRWDPYYSQVYFRDAFKAVESGKYPVSNLKSISELITSGITPKSGGEAYTEDRINGVPFIRSGNISIDGELNYDDLLYLRPIVHETVMSSSKLRMNDLLIAIVGATIGQVGIYLSNEEANINQAIALVRLKEGNNIQFVKELLKSSIGQLSLNRLKRPVARANINLEEIGTIKIVLPPLDKQNEIASHIFAIRQKAKALQEEGNAILEEAKRNVESMIIGK